MDAYCPRCKITFPGVDEATLVRGRCQTCEGQLTIGGIIKGQGPEGAVAMTFAPGSRVAVALDAAFESAQFDLDKVVTKPVAKATSRKPPPPPPDDFDASDRLPAHLGLAPGLMTASDELTMVPSGVDPFASDDLPRPTERSSTPPMSNEPAAPSPISFDNAPTVANFAAPSVAPEEPAAAVGGVISGSAPTEWSVSESEQSGETAPAPGPPTAVDEPLTSSPFNQPTIPAAPAAPMFSAPPASEPTPAPRPAPVVGAHLQLPSIDFSMPDFGTVRKDLPPMSPSAAGDLPAHLQLPNFPDFQLPPIPGQENEHRDTELEIKGVPDGSFAAMPSTEVTAPQLPPVGEADDWAVGQGAHVRAPPPLPAGPPPLKPRAKPVTSSEDGLPDLPALGLPMLKSAVPSRDPTLLQSEAAQAVLADMQSRRFSFGMFVAVVLVLLLVGAGGGLAYFGPNRVASWFVKDTSSSIGPNKRDLADEKLVAGKKAYLVAEEAEKAKRAADATKNYQEAIALFEQALRVDVTYGQVHRNLGIAYAKTNQQAKAVEQYELYLRKVSTAPDRGAVQKIIEDYRKAKEKNKGR